MQAKVLLGVLVLCCAFSKSSVDGASHPLLANDPTNRLWHAPPEAQEAVYIGDEKQPVRLALKKEALVAAPVKLSLQTDAKTCIISGADTSFEIALPEDPNIEISLDANAARPTLVIAGKVPMAQRGKWIQVCLNPKVETVYVELKDATFAAIGLAEGGRGALPVVQTRLDGAATTVPVVEAAGEAAINLERAKRAVLQVRVKNEKGRVYGSGTGFLIAHDGHAITNFHVLAGADSAVAVVADGTEELPIELLHMRPELDLAMFKVKLPEAAASVLDLETTVHDGEDVYALGYPLSLGYTVTKGVVNGTRRISELPEKLRRSLSEYSKTSAWIQTDCTINAGNSGGPLINGRGKVIGVNTFSLLIGDNVYFALSASHVRELMALPVPAAMTFADAKKLFKTTKSIWSVFPSDIPKIIVVENATATQLAGAAHGLMNGIIRDCRGCSGRGTETTQVQAGVRREGVFNRPITRTVTRACSACGGRRQVRATPDATYRLVTNAVSVICRLKQSDPKAQDELQRTYTALADAVCGDSQARDVVETKARGLFAQRRLAEATPIAAFGHLLLSAPLPDSEERVHFVLEARSNQIVLLTNPRLASGMEPGAPVFVGGMAAGTTEAADGRPVFVLQNGFVIPDGG